MGMKISPAKKPGAEIANKAFIIGFFTILGAWAFELLGGYEPCQLCLAQRNPYYLGLPIIAILLVFWEKFPQYLRLAITLLAGAVFVWSVYLGTIHAGIEWSFWQGPSACAGGASTISFSDLNALNDARVIPCDEPQFRFLGISFAGYNALISLLMVLLLAQSATRQFKAINHKLI